MKRHASSSLEAGRERRPRQDPVSCALCRSKKLKCSRQQPCTNCVSRAVACDYGQGRPAENMSSVTSGFHNPVTDDVLARLYHLEKIVASIPPEILKEKQQNDAPLPTVFTPISNVISPASAVTPGNAHNAAFVNVESATTSGNVVAYELNDRLIYSVAPIAQLANHVDDLGSLAGDSVGGNGRKQHIWLPEEQEAQALFAEYARTIEYMYHVTHFSTTRSMIGGIYNDIRTRQPVDAHQVALLLSILAGGSYFLTYKPGDPVNLLPSAESPARLSGLWKTWTLDILDQIRRTAVGSIEELQATTIVCAVIHNLEGFSGRVRILNNTAMTIAIHLQIHIMDSPDQRARNPESSVRDLITNEVKRRNWWHIVSSDWLMANVAGPSQGIYHIQPRHFMVNFPRNLNDEDLENGKDVVEQDDSIPTTMSFHVIRARGAELARRTIDILPPAFNTGTGIDNINYDDLLELETSSDEFIAREVPFFFRFDDESRRKSKDLDKRFPQLPFQRAMMSIGIHHARIRMHRPYLVRLTQNPRYEHSHRACLNAARKTLEVWRSLREERPPGTSPSRITLIIHHVFTAVLMLALDLCFIPPASKEDEERGWGEVRDACRALDEARKVSPVANTFLTPLMEILRKHHQDQERPKKSNDELTAENLPSPNFNHITIPNDWSEQQSVDGDLGLPDQQTLGSDLDMQWEDVMNFAPIQEPLDWDQLFADLDACYMY